MNEHALEYVNEHVLVWKVLRLVLGKVEEMVEMRAAEKDCVMVLKKVGLSKG